MNNLNKFIKIKIKEIFMLINKKVHYEIKYKKIN